MLNSRQITTIIINAITVKMLITLPTSVIAVCGNAAWISALYCTLIAAAIFAVTRAVYVSDKNVIMTADRLGGGALRIIIGIIVFITLGANFFTIMRTFPEVIRLVLLQQTYSEVIRILFAAAIVLGAYCGIEAIGRVHGMFIPIAGAVFIIFILLLIPSMEYDNIFPLLGKGPKALFIDNIPFLSLFSDLLMLNILLPYVKNRGEYKKAGTKAVFIGGAAAIIIFTAYGLSYVYPASERFMIPVYQLERLIRLSSFFSRFEAVLQFIWTICILIYGSLYLSVLAEVWKESFKLKRKKPVILPVAAVLVCLSLLPESMAGIISWETAINRWIYIPALALPIIIGITDKMFHVKHSKGVKDRNAKSI